MLACLLFAFLLPPAITSTGSLLARRALPLLSGGLAGWFSVSAGNGWTGACIVAFATVTASSFALDYLVQRRSVRRVVIATEATAGAGLCALPIYTLLNSSGIHGAALWGPCMIATFVAAGASFEFRTGEEDPDRA